MKAFLVVLDSVGIGAAPDASDYGDSGSSTLSHIAQAVGGISLPTLQKLGLGNIPPLIPTGAPIKGVETTTHPLASYGAMRELSQGKDTTTGHWEMAGLLLEKGFHIFPHDYPSFPRELTLEFERLTGRKSIGNKAANGLAIIDELGQEHIKTGSWIIYTSADSVFQIAAHEQVIPLEELYRGCEIARRLCDPYFVGRIIARPFVGSPGNFKRTENRRDFSFPPPGTTILDHLVNNGIKVFTVGKLDDVFRNRGITQSFHVENNTDAQKILLDLTGRQEDFFAFANLIDFDMLYGHRRDSKGYARCLVDTDSFLAVMTEKLKQDDILIISADHGNDPTFKGSDHTREFVPLLVYSPSRKALQLGIRNGFFDVAQSIADFFHVPAMPKGVSFLHAN